MMVKVVLFQIIYYCPPESIEKVKDLAENAKVTGSVKVSDKLALQCGHNDISMKYDALALAFSKGIFQSFIQVTYKDTTSKVHLYPC